MLPRTSLVALALASFAVACSSGGTTAATTGDDSSFAPAADRAPEDDTSADASSPLSTDAGAKSDGSKQASAPAWLAAGSSWNESHWNGGDLITSSYVLDADGTGTLRIVKIDTILPYGVGNTDATIPLRWSATDATITLQGTSHELLVSPSCGLLELDDLVFGGGPKAPCPFTNPPLTASESALVGHWYGRWQVDPFTFGSLDIKMYPNRTMHAVYLPSDDPSSYDAAEALGYLTTDTDGKLHLNAPDGTEEIEGGASASVSGTQMTFCFPGCVTLDKKP